MTTARDIMHVGAECIDEHETLARADDRLTGIITDRDIVIRCVAAGRDPEAVTARGPRPGQAVHRRRGRRRVAGPAGNGGAPDPPPAGDRQSAAGGHDH